MDRTALPVTVRVCILLCFMCTTGGKVQLSSDITEIAGMSIACIGQKVFFECTGQDIVLIRWVMEPFVNRSDPLTFTPNSGVGSCHIFGTEQLPVTFCLIAISPAPDGASVNMTSTLMFDLEENSGVDLSGTVIHCNGRNTTLQVIKDIPPPPVDLKCNSSDSFSNSTYRITCTWSPQSQYIQSYQFNISSTLNGSESHAKLVPVTANVTMLEFTLMCPFDGIVIDAVSDSYCNSSRKTTVISIPGKCSEKQEQHGGQTVTAVVVVTVLVIAAVVIGLVLIRTGITRVVILQGRKFNTKPQVKWKRCHDLPVGMSQVHVVKINNKLYCGGGNNRTIYTCTICDGIKLSEWGELNKNCPVEMFALTHFSINGHRNLVALGGVNCGQSVLAEKIHVYPIEGESNPEWNISTHLGNLNIPRLYPAAITYKVPKKQEYIIVCGGIPSLNPSAESTDIVEIYNDNCWRNITRPLPMKRNCLSLACVDGHLYVMGGVESEKMKKNVVKMHLASLPQVSEWKEVNSCPLADSTAVGVGDKKLLAVGGKITQWWPLSLLWNFEDQRSVYVYDMKSYKWVYIGQTESKVYMAGAVQLSKNFVMIGGQCEDNVPQKSVYIGTYNIAQ